MLKVTYLFREKGELVERDEPFFKNKVCDFVKHISDENKTLLQIQTLREYDEVVDIYPTKYTYVEMEDRKDEIEQEGK